MQQKDRRRQADEAEGLNMPLFGFITARTGWKVGSRPQDYPARLIGTRHTGRVVVISAAET